MKAFFIFCAMCSLAGHFLAIKAPIIQERTFLSTNFENIFTWKIEEGSPPGTVYQVQYKIYGAAYWHSKAECQNITQLFCNLTRETENVTEHYYARVRAIVPNCCVSNWVQSIRFCPKDDTTIGKPSVNYIPGLQSIKFSIQPPYTPLRDKENRILTVVDIYNELNIDIQYEITLFSQKMQQKWEKTGNDKEFEITKLDPGMEYNGTVHLKYLGKNGNPQTFQIWTLSDTRWLPYVLGMILFILLFLFGTIYYSIYKYIKHHTDQKPASLDFKNVSRFRPLILNVELSPSSLSKTTLHVPEVRPAELCQPILNMLKHQESFSPTEVAYQQQTKTLPIQTPVQHFRQGDAPSTGYTPQVIKNSPLCPLKHNPSTLTYGLCMEGASSINKANHVIKLDSFISTGPYKAQRPEWANEELQESETHQKPEEEVKSVSQTQPFTFPEDSIGLPEELPCLLREWVPPTTDGRTGSYRKQAELFSSSSNIGPNAISDGPNAISVNSLLKPCPSKNLSQDLNLGPQSAWNLLACTDNVLPSKPPKLQIIDCSAQQCQELKNEASTLGLTANTLESPQIDRPFSSLFRDLELKLQWDSGPEENKAAL